MARKVFNKKKDVHILIGDTIVCFRKNSKQYEVTATRSISWLYEMFLASVYAIKKAKPMFETEQEYDKFKQNLIDKIKHDDI